jgi:hypothetical protein
MNLTTIGIDLAKNTFSLHGTDTLAKPQKPENSNIHRYDKTRPT